MKKSLKKIMTELENRYKGLHVIKDYHANYQLPKEISLKYSTLLLTMDNEIDSKTLSSHLSHCKCKKYFKKQKLSNKILNSYHSPILLEIKYVPKKDNVDKKLYEIILDWDDGALESFALTLNLITKTNSLQSQDFVQAKHFTKQLLEKNGKLSKKDAHFLNDKLNPYNHRYLKILASRQYSKDKHDASLYQLAISPKDFLLNHFKQLVNDYIEDNLLKICKNCTDLFIPNKINRDKQLYCSDRCRKQKESKRYYSSNRERIKKEKRKDMKATRALYKRLGVDK